MDIILQFSVILACLLVGTRYGGMGLGLISGIGIFILVFICHLPPGKPPIDVILTILAVIGCASVLQSAKGLDVMMQYAERFLRKHPKQITILAPLTTWFLTLLCGTGHVVYTMFPIINGIALQKGIRPERPMAVASIASQMGICASPVSVAIVSMVSLLSSSLHGTEPIKILDILKISIPATLIGVLIAAIWSLNRGKDLDQDQDFQQKIKDPKQRDYIFGAQETLLNHTFTKQAYWSMFIFFTAIMAVVILGAYEALRPSFLNTKNNVLQPLSMNLTIQIIMLLAGSFILMTCRVKSSEIANTTVFKAGMVAIFSVFGVAWMSDTFLIHHLDYLKKSLEEVVKHHAWTYGLVLFLVSKLVNSQAAALSAIVPVGIALGLDAKMLIAFLPACYGYFILPTYPSDIACIGFDRSGTTKIGKYIINHSFLIPGLIAVVSACVVSNILVNIVM